MMSSMMESRKTPPMQIAHPTALSPEIDSLNTIADLAHHIHYYICGIKNVFKGGSLEIKDIYSFDFQPIQSENEWKDFLTKFWNDAEAFALLIEQMPDEKLQQVFIDEKYGTYQRDIEGMIDHNYYHLGQIVLIKKLLSTSPGNDVVQG